MARKIWKFELEGKTHNIELDHKYLTSKREILVDGKKLEIPKAEVKPFFDRGSTHDFKIGKHICTIIISTNGITYSYDLLIDGTSKKTGKKVTGDLSQLKYLAYLFNKIDNKDFAESILKMASYGIIGITGFSAIVMTFVGGLEAWLDFVIAGFLALWLLKRQSQIAAILLIILLLTGVVVTFMNNIYNSGGSNIYLAIFLFALAIRGFQASRWLQKQKTAITEVIPELNNKTISK